MKAKQAGFTLVEIAIVLVIIGLLLGGVLKGQELVTQARIKNIANDFNGISAAVFTYQDRYKALPGDDRGSAARWPLATAGDGNGTIAAGGEDAEFWFHLRLAGLISGDSSTVATGTLNPLNAASGRVTVANTAAGLNGVVICSEGLSGKIAEAVDSQFDNGKPKTGAVRAWILTAGAYAAIPGAGDAFADTGSEQYMLCKNL